MTDKTPTSLAKEGRKVLLSAREKRLKAALKDNMAKRKAQAKSRGQDAAAEQTDK